MAILSLLVIAACAGACYLYLPHAPTTDESQEPVLEKGQEYAYAKITSILGNEMEYIVLDAQDSKMLSAGEKPGNMESMPSGGGMPDMGSMPSGGGFPDMGNKPWGGGMPGGDNAGKTKDSGKQKVPARDGADNTQNTATVAYTETDETGQMQIPVGTEVETKLGTVTTFLRLSNGDIIKMLLQKDDTGEKSLIKIWIVE